MKPPTPVETELASRLLSRRRLLPFVQRVNTRYQAGWVHEDICRRLEKFSNDVADRKSPRLMLLMPPRSGKSELCSRSFPSWHLGRHPHHEIIACSYNVSLAMTFSKKVKELLQDPVYHPVFDIRLDPNNQSAEEWALDRSQNRHHSGAYVAAGVGGGITGKGAHLLIIDDPLKNAEEADSADTREKLWDWYGSTAYTRLAPGGGVLVVQTWWHDDDLAGRLQVAMASDPEADQFVVVKYPAIADSDEYLDYSTDLIVGDPPDGPHKLLRRKGEALHPERYDLDKLNQIRRTISPRFWSALYQQNPVPDDGAYFLKEHFRRGPPPHITRSNVFIAWDFAISEKRQNDYTVGTVLLQDDDDTLHVAEQLRFKSGDAFFIVEAILDLSKKWYTPGQQLGFEDGQIYRAIESLLKKRMRERHFYPSIKVLKPITDKLARARPLQGRMQQGRVSFNNEGEWYDVCRLEMLRFPAGAHDDCCLVAGTMITMSDGTYKPIEAVAVGDLVATPLGACTVEAACMTNPSAEVLEITLSNGVTLTGTDHHPVWSPQRSAFIPLAAIDLTSNLEYHTTISIKEKSSWRESIPKPSPVSAWSLMVGFIGATRSRLANTFATISRALAPSITLTFGSSTTGLCLQGGTFTTATTTPRTTTYRTSNVCPASSTLQPTPKQVRAMSRPRILGASGISQKLGTLPPKVWRGIRRTLERLGVLASPQPSFVSTVELGLSPSLLRPSSAGAPVGPSHGQPAILNITGRKKLGKRPVYNLTVADAHIYFANGILNHNCDSLSWATQMAIGREPPAKIKYKEPDSWVKKLKQGSTAHSFMSA